MTRTQLAGAVLIAIGLSALADRAVRGKEATLEQDAAALQQRDPPPNGIWVDTLDLSRVPIRRPRAGGPGRRGQSPPAAGQPATPPVAPASPPAVPPVAPASPPAVPLVPAYALGGVTYPHAVPLESDRDLAIDVKGHAVSFASMVGIDSTVAAGRGSVIFGVWVDGKKVADSGLMRGGDAPKLLTADLARAKRLVLAVIDGNDGTGGDTANWGGALITMAPNAPQRPEVIVPAAEPAPPIASSLSAVPLLNYPRITGATPGKPFMFLIPASGDEPLTFAARNLPAGLTLDAKTGLITGALKQAGRTAVEITVRNAKGRTTGTLTIVGGDDVLALTPPLGWNSWNAWGNTVTAERVRASADGMVKSGLHRQGYAYINIDDVWEGGTREDPATGRDANGEIFSICQYGAGNVWEWGREVGGELWRMTGDIRDSWPSMSGIGFQQTGREQYAGPGGWNDTDMLVVGMVGWSQGSRPSDLTPNEQLTHMALWALQAAPLLIGADLSKIDEWTTNVLGNREMLAVNQDVLGKPAGRKTSDGWVEVWARPLADGTIAAGLFNRGPEPATVVAKWSELGLTGSQPVRDLWLQKDLGRVNDQLSATIPRHGVLFVRIGQPR